MSVEDIFDEFSKKKILVVGDVMIDAYLRGSVNRISPEAPVPIINLNSSDQRLGGAANVALNLLSLGATPILCGVVGDDGDGQKFTELLNKRGLTNKGVYKSKGRKTTVKTRVIGNNQHLLRIDSEVTDPLSSQEEQELLNLLENLINDGVDAVIIEDYNKGMLSPVIIQGLISLAKAAGCIVTVDPKKENFFEYKGVTLFKPNLKELREGLNVDGDLMADKNLFEETIQRLEAKLHNEISFVTLSEHGVFIKQNDSKDYIPAHIRKIADVSGAGDTVISVATLCLSVGLSPKDVAAIANLSGGLVCEFSGVVPIDKDLLKKEVSKLVLA